MPPQSREAPKRVGDVRPSQLMFTYGVGAIVDLPFLSVLVMGLDDWKSDPTVAPPIVEERLLQAVRWQMGPQVRQLLAPPSAPEGSSFDDPFSEAARVGIPVATFPRWMVCPQCHQLAPLGSRLFTLDENRWRPDRTRHVHSNCQKSNRPTVVPARFLVACEQGHLDDFPWVEFVHRGPTTCESALRLLEFGPTGEARDLQVRCDTCNQARILADAFGERGRQMLPACRGRRPHLRDYEPTPCTGQLRTILLGASNLWFPDVLATLAIPTDAVGLTRLVGEQWARLQHFEGIGTVSLMRQMRIGDLAELFLTYEDEEIWRAIQRRREQDDSDAAEQIDLKQPEWELLTHPASAPASEDFRLRRVETPAGFEDVLEKVVLVEKLREVRALIGFTRIDAPGELGATPDAARERRMPLSRQRPTWVPATEVRGEGIFLHFREERLQAWLREAAVRARDEQFFDSHCRWRAARFIEPEEEEYPGMRYVLLHTIAHALMRQMVLESGYVAASIRERLYIRNPDDSEANPEPMAGILLYTAASDSEGTLGGLVSQGEPEVLARHLRTALRDAGLCGSDPLCAEHHPSQRGITLHAAACHACLFAPETSCERGNKYLDRSVLVPTVERDNLAFFEGIV